MKETEPKSYLTTKEIEHIILDANRNSREQTISDVLEIIEEVFYKREENALRDYFLGIIDGRIEYLTTYPLRYIGQIMELESLIVEINKLKEEKK